MTIPVAVSPSVLTPGLHLLINLLAGPASPGTGVLKILLLCPKASTGDLTVDTEVRTGGGEDSAGVAYGIGSPGHLTAKQIYAEYPTAIVDFGAPTSGAGSATGNITITGAPTENTWIDVNVHGRTFQVPWLVGESADDIRDKMISYTNQRTSDLATVASSGGAGVVTNTGKVTGNISNDIKIFATLGKAQTGTEAVTPNTPTALSGGSADPDFADILDAAKGIEYHIILPCLSNTDAHLTSTSSAEDVLTHIEAYHEGLDAKLQQLLYATTGARASARTAAVARNVGYAEQVNGLNFMSLPCEVAGAECGNRLAAVAIRANYNRIGNRLGGAGVELYGSVDVNSDKPELADSEADLGSGVTPLTYDASGNILLVRPVTTYSQDAGGGPDRRLLDVPIIDGTYVVARDLRSYLPQQYPNVSIQADTAPGEDPPPEGVIEERDIKASVISRLRVWQRLGVVLKASLDQAIEDETLIVRVNPSDATQVDLVLPFSIVPPLAKFGLVINRVPL